MFTKLTEDFLNCWGRVLPGQMVVAGDGLCCPHVPSSPFPDQPRPSLGPQPPVPTALGHWTWSPHQGPATQPGQAWAGVNPSPPPPRAIPHPPPRVPPGLHCIPVAATPDHVCRSRPERLLEAAKSECKTLCDLGPLAAAPPAV